MLHFNLDSAKPISRDERELAEAQMALNARTRTAATPMAGKVRQACEALRAAVKRHNKAFRQ
jgi:hypothetical protein